MKRKAYCPSCTAELQDFPLTRKCPACNYILHGDEIIIRNDPHKCPRCGSDMTKTNDLEAHVCIHPACGFGILDPHAIRTAIATDLKSSGAKGDSPSAHPLSIPSPGTTTSEETVGTLAVPANQK